MDLQYDMSVLGEYLAEFSHGDLAAAGPNPPRREEVTVLNVQRFLNKLGYQGANNKALVEDGKYGNNTAHALRKYLEQYNRTNNANATFEALGINRIIITGGVGQVVFAPNTPTPAKPKPAATPAPVVDTTGMAQVSVLKVQQALKANGLTITADGKWGPITQRLWQTLAGQKGLDPKIARATATSAWVIPATLSAIEAATPTAPQAISITVKVDVLQKLMNARGRNLVVDGKYGPKTEAAWKTLADSLGLSPSIARVSATSAKVARATLEAVQAGSATPTGQATITSPVTAPGGQAAPQAAPVPAGPPAQGGRVAVPLIVVQKAWNEVVLSNPAAGKAQVVNGKYDGQTKVSIQRLTGVAPSKQSTILNPARTAINIAPTTAEQLNTLAQRHDARTQQAQAAQTTQAAQTQSQDIPVSVDQVQKALNRFNGRVDDLLYPITGVWDDKTQVGYMSIANISVSAVSGLQQRLSPDKRVIAAAPHVVEAINILARQWEEGRAQAATPAPQATPQPQPQQQEQTFAPPVPPEQPQYEEAPQYAPPPPASPQEQEVPQPATASPGGGSSNTGLIIGGVAAAAGLAYYLSKRQ